MKYFAWVSCILLFTSCGGWSNTDKLNFKDKCEKAKYDHAYCDCALEKMINKYESFDDMTSSPENEITTGNLLIDCLDKDLSTDQEED